MNPLREFIATILVQIGMWCVSIASMIDGGDEDTSKSFDNDLQDAFAQSPITAEAAELLAPPIARKRTKKAVDKPLRGSIRARREKATIL
jgi:hypothetical protein